MTAPERVALQRGRRWRRRGGLALAAILAVAGGASLRSFNDRDPIPEPSKDTVRLSTTFIGVTHAESVGETLVSGILVASDPLSPATVVVQGLDPELTVVVAPEGPVTLRLAFARGGADGVRDAVQNLLGLRVDEIAMVDEVSLAQSLPSAGFTIDVPFPVLEDGELVTPAGPVVMASTEAVAYLSGLFDVTSRSQAVDHQLAFWRAVVGLGAETLSALPDAVPGFPSTVAAALVRIANAHGAEMSAVPLLEVAGSVSLDRVSYEPLAVHVRGAWLSPLGPTLRPQIVLSGVSDRLAGVLSLLIEAGIEIVEVGVASAPAGTVVETVDLALGQQLLDALGEGTVRPPTNLPPSVVASIVLGPSLTPQGAPSS